MKTGMVNQVVIEGRIYQHNLEVKTVQNQKSANYGTQYIGGTIDVATDDAGLNILTVRYGYVVEKTKAGKTNATYTNLKKIIDGGKTVLANGMDAATKVKLQPSGALNDFYPKDGDEVISMQTNEGGFVSLVNELHDEKQRNTFTFDTLIIGTNEVEKDDDSYLELRCAIFNFRNEILPYTLIARDPRAIEYFKNLDPSGANPVFTKVWGNIDCKTIKSEKVTESAFGDAAVDVVERRVREWVVTGAIAEPYEFGVEETITAEDLKKAMADRNVKLAEIKKNSDEYWANKGGSDELPFKTPTTIPEGGFNF